jgi:hypothetical protein
LPVAVIKTPYTRQGDLTDSFVNRAGGAPASFARLIKINGEQVQGCACRGLGSLVSRRPKGCSHGERAGAKKNYKNNLAEGGGSQLGWKTCVTSSPEEIAGKTVCHERTTAVAERPALGLLEPSSIPDGGKRRKINEATRQESTVEIIILMLRKEGGMPSTSSLKFRAFGIPPSWFPLGLCARLYVRNIVSDARVCRQCFSLS